MERVFAMVLMLPGDVVNPFTTEPETLAKMLDFIQANGFGKNGLHHETYLSDFRNTEPERLKAILREPVL